MQPVQIWPACPCRPYLYRLHSFVAWPSLDKRGSPTQPRRSAANLQARLSGLALEQVRAMSRPLLCDCEFATLSDGFRTSAARPEKCDNRCNQMESRQSNASPAIAQSQVMRSTDEI